jgi:hypothetical protein
VCVCALGWVGGPLSHTNTRARARLRALPLSLSLLRLCGMLFAEDPGRCVYVCMCVCVCVCVCVFTYEYIVYLCLRIPYTHYTPCEQEKKIYLSPDTAEVGRHPSTLGEIPLDSLLGVLCVKRDLVCVKRDLVCVKKDLVCVLWVKWLFCLGGGGHVLELVEGCRV